MSSRNIGTLIKKLRIQQGITQEELAYPLVEQSSMSRIESGQIMPNRRTIELLLERLGCDYRDIDIFVDNKEEKIYTMQKELEGLLVIESAFSDQDERTAKADEILKKLEDDKEFMAERMNQQYVLTYKAFSAWFKKTDKELVLQMYMDAIKISIPEYDENKVDKYYLSTQEVRLITMTTAVYRDIGRVDDAIKILSLLKKNFEEQCIDKTARGESYPVILNNLVLMFFYGKKYEETVKMCDRAAEVCKEIGERGYRFLPVITAYKANSLYLLGDRSESLRLFRQTYYTAEMFGMHNWKEMMKAGIKELFDIEIA